METTARVRQIARDVLGYPGLRPGQLEAAAALADGRLFFTQYNAGLIGEVVLR